jgi:hypothetical protein
VLSLQNRNDRNSSWKPQDGWREQLDIHGSIMVVITVAQLNAIRQN